MAKNKLKTTYFKQLRTGSKTGPVTVTVDKMLSCLFCLKCSGCIVVKITNCLWEKWCSASFACKVL